MFNKVTHFNRVSGINGIFTGPKGFEVQLRGNEVAGKVYYVDGNAGLDTNNGSSWAMAFKTVTVAMAASHANIAASSAGWAARNKIYIKGDTFVENLTTLAQKTDIIGIGSYDANPMPGITGNHVIVGTFVGCRFINVRFKSPDAGGMILDVPLTCAGFSLLGCIFDGIGTTPATIAVRATGFDALTIEDCQFIGEYSTATIDIGAGSGRSMLIRDNIIESGAIGIRIDIGYTCANQGGIGKILNNTFYVVTLVVDDNSDKVIIGGNRGRTAANGTLVLTIDYNALLCWDNMITGSATTSIYPVITATIPT